MPRANRNSKPLRPSAAALRDPSSSQAPAPTPQPVFTDFSRRNPPAPTRDCRATWHKTETRCVTLCHLAKGRLFAVPGALRRQNPALLKMRRKRRHALLQLHPRSLQNQLRIRRWAIRRRRRMRPSVDRKPWGPCPQTPAKGSAPGPRLLPLLPVRYQRLRRIEKWTRLS